MNKNTHQVIYVYCIICLYTWQYESWCTHLHKFSLSTVSSSYINTVKPRQYGCHFAGDIVKCIFLNENARIFIKISLKFVPYAPLDDKPTLVQIMAWDKQATSHYLTQWWITNVISLGLMDNKSYCFRLWLGTKQAISHCLSQWWPSCLINKCVNRPQWINSLRLSYAYMCQ